MRTGQSGRVAISWAQTELDGLEGAPLSFMAVGAVWSWRGHILCVEEFTDTAKGLRARLPDHFISEQDLLTKKERLRQMYAAIPQGSCRR